MAPKSLSWDSGELATSTINYEQGRTRTRVEVPIHPDLEARLLANAGVSADLRMRLPGHKSLVVHQRYSHVELEPLRKAVSVLPRLSGEDEG